MSPKRFGGLLLTVMIAASTVDDVVVAQRTVNKCCANNERLYWNSDRYLCATARQQGDREEGITVDAVEEERLKTNLSVEVVEPVTVPFLDVDADFEFGKFMKNLNSFPNMSLAVDDILSGAFPSCSSEDTDWLFAPNFSVRMTPSDVTLLAAQREEFPIQMWCVDLDVDEDLVAVLCPCTAADRPCVRKCCLSGEALDESQVCVDSVLKNWKPTQENPKETYYLLKNKLPTCEFHSAKKFPHGQLKLQADGSMKGHDENGRDFAYAPRQYCADATNSFNTSDSVADQTVIFCIETDKVTDAITIFKGAVTLVGAMALLVTVVLTLFLPEMTQSIYGKMALCHNASLLCAFICICVFHVSPGMMSSSTCKVLSFVMQYTLLAAFFWLNVMCIEVSWAFGALRPVKKMMTDDVDMKFKWYSLYAWGATSIISLITMLVEFVPEAKLKPRFGEGHCFFHGDDMLPSLLFLFGPMGILLAINLGLFVYTSTKIITHRRQTAILKTNDSNTSNSCNNQNFVLYTKLFTMMGVTWVFEIISWAVGGKNYYWLPIDCVNLLRGIFIFLIFCCKRSVLDSLRARLGCSPASDIALSLEGTKSTMASKDANVL